MPSNCRKTQLSPASFRRTAYSGSFARRIPFVFNWKNGKPFSFPRRMISSRSLRTEGSPPESWILNGPPQAIMESYHSPISASEGSFTSSPSPALAKQTGQLRLHRFVTSSKTQQVCCRCSGQSPQSYGQPFSTCIAGFFCTEGSF